MEVILDASRVSGRNMEVLAVYSADLDKAAYLPPQVIAELTEDLESCCPSSGPADGDPKPAPYRWTDEGQSLRAKKRCKDTAVVDNSGQCSEQRTGGPQLENLSLPRWPPYCRARRLRVSMGNPPRWFHTDSTGRTAVPELSDPLLWAIADGSLPMLLLTGDQDSSQRSASHFLFAPARMGFMGGVMDDEFHRSYNDFKSAARRSEGHLYHTIIQMCHAHNTNYGPFLRAANMATKRELLPQWRHAAPCPDEEWRQHVDAVTTGSRGACAATESDVARLYNEGVLRNKSFINKGMFSKHAAWYSVVESMDLHDRMFTTWRYMMRALPWS